MKLGGAPVRGVHADAPSDMATLLDKYNPADDSGQRQTLRDFQLDDLARYTAEGAFKEDAFGGPVSLDFRRFMVGRDDVHGVLMHLHSRACVSALLSMYGYDDDELNDTLMYLAHLPQVLVEITLDLSQSKGVHERKLLESDAAQDAEAYATDFVVGQSATHQILHTKGGILDGIVAFDGSTNWSAGGEGIGIGLRGAANAKGFKAQANTLTVFVNQWEISKFAAQLRYERTVAKQQQITRAEALAKLAA